MISRRWLLGIAAAIPLLAQAQAYPTKPIAMIVPFAAGGAPDITARRLAKAMSEALHVPVTVDNKTGAGATLGAAYAARAPKDGYTLLFGTSSTWAINPYLFNNLQYSLDDFTPVSLVSKQAIVLNAALNLPAKTFPELLALSKARGTPITYGTSGSGSLTHIIGEWMGKSVGMNVTQVPYKGQSAANIDLLAGRIDTQLEGVTSAAAMHAAGKTRVLASLADERSPLLPDVPTFKELGYPDLVAYTTFGVMAPAGTPQDVVERLHKTISTIVQSAEFGAPMRAKGEIPEHSPSAAQYRSYTRAEYEKWGRIIKPMNLTVN